MKKYFSLLFLLICILVIEGCVGGNSNSFILGELPEAEDRERIGNEIPQWVSDADWNKPLYVVSSSDREHFDAYAQENFPDYCDAGWTQEQSDAVYLGQGMEMFALDGETQINRMIYYPVILNGVIVGGYQVWEQLDGNELSMQASPYLANELNILMDLTSEDTPLILGFHNNNTIGMIRDTCYVLDIDHVEHKEVEVDKIPAIETNTCVNAMDILCSERRADVEDWVVVGR